MSFICPNCRQRTIPGNAKFFAAPHAPAKCDACGTLCAESRGPAVAVSIAANIGLFVALFAAVRYFSMMPLVVYGVALIAVLWLRQRFVPLFPITEAVAAGERRLRTLTLVGFVALVAIASLSSAFWK